MSDQGEKTCPLCAEEMDLTDQQLKPCKCGYQICVWCWHHIMDMAEKDDTEGRCPACRSPYDKEKIVGMAANCERLVAEINSERKKPQKSKTKSSDGRKQLSSVRVIQRNLVYIVGLPLNLADEDLLQHREYFGQYGKVLKVSMSRTAAGVIQQFPNNTCSVYITYSREEEAVRCIQSVHGFVLDGRSLKACFGTTKYCHAWLRNVPCTNPDCLYLHEIGSQEDSFTKDEIISAYTRSRVQQITGATNNLQRRAGNMLPPPADDFCNNPVLTAKPTVKNVTTLSSNTTSTSRGSLPNGSSGRSVGLPAAASWGTRPTNQPPLASLPSSNGPYKHIPETASNTLPFSTSVASMTPVPNDVGKKLTMNGEIQTTLAKGKADLLKPLRQHVSMDCQTTAFEKPVVPDGISDTVSLSSQLSCLTASKDKERATSVPPANSFDHPRHPPEKEGHGETNEKIQDLCSDLSSMSIGRDVRKEHCGVMGLNCSLSDQELTKLPVDEGLQQYQSEQYREQLSAPAVGKAATSINGLCASAEDCDWRTDQQTHAAINMSSEIEDDVVSFDNQRLKDPEVVSRSTFLPNSANSLHLSSHSRSHSLQQNDVYGAFNVSADPLFVDSKASNSTFLHASGVSVSSNGYPEKLVTGSDRTVDQSLLLPNELKGKHVGRFHSEADSSAGLDTGENSIISNILDFDTWDDSLTSPQNLAKLLGETENQPSSLTISSSRKSQSNNQSRFSFARQEESKNQVFDVEPSFSVFGQLPNNRSFSKDFSENRDGYMEKFGISNGFSSSSFEASDTFTSNPSVFSSNKFSAVSRSQISAPPGFSVPNRAPPPGFSTHERADQAFDTMSGNHLFDSSSLLRNSYQLPPTGNIGNTGDIEFLDPAILAVGKGRLQGGHNSPGLDVRSNFPSQLSAFENEARLQLLMQRSLSPHQNLRVADFGDNFSSLSDSYSISSRLMDQSQVSNLSPYAQLSLQQSRNSPMSNGHWDGWNDVQGGNSIGMAELIRNERLGYNKFYSGYEDSKFRMPSSGDLYNRTFGM
ncbi:RRM_5 domain-containing protein [Cephalotus follicularis]|uniref:RRM_5 domain-containing protein n=1 Tax=Cephalotus follicularis TaxID=3775 RepID=A0A1Q3BUD7_CEPFO|nr:RRM_5 domain-containing protein [Cephalotus follicularis]